MSYNRCIEHTIHLMATHFIKALGIPSLSKTKNQIDAKDDFDVDVSMDIEASTDNAEAIQMSTVTEFAAGDVVGKLMAFIAQLWQCSEGTRKYLEHLAVSYGCRPLEIKIWVRTRWGSLSDCFHVILILQKVCFYFFYHVKHLTHSLIQPIDRFCHLVDNEDDLPPLVNGKWANYQLLAAKWKIIKLAHHCLSVSQQFIYLSCSKFLSQIPAATHGELSVHKEATCYKVFPLLERLQTQWEALCANDEYEPIHAALDAGLINMQKWYQKTDNTSIYFISHGRFL